MLRKLSLALAATLIMAGTALADPIEGNWKTQAGDTAAIGGSGSFSITLKTGKYAGKTRPTTRPIPAKRRLPGPRSR